MAMTDSPTSEACESPLLLLMKVGVAGIEYLELPYVMTGVSYEISSSGVGTFLAANALKFIPSKNGCYLMASMFFRPSRLSRDGLVNCLTKSAAAGFMPSGASKSCVSI